MNRITSSLRWYKLPSLKHSIQHLWCVALDSSGRPAVVLDLLLLRRSCSPTGHVVWLTVSLLLHSAGMSGNRDSPCLPPRCYSSNSTGTSTPLQALQAGARRRTGGARICEVDLAEWRRSTNLAEWRRRRGGRWEARWHTRARRR